ncbi:MAG: YeeE/YedE family protein [Hyphomicrobium sp.]
MLALGDLLARDPATGLALGGLVIGCLFGALVQATNFCVMGAISDWRAFGATGRLGAVALAAAVAIVMTQAIASADLVALDRSMYLAPRINWFGAIAGGALFGYGMVLAGGCASRNLTNGGGGDLRALVTVLMVAVAAYAAMGGVIGPIRAAIDDATAFRLTNPNFSTPSLPALAEMLGFDEPKARFIATLAIAPPLLMFAFIRARLFQDVRNLIGGIGIGLLVGAGWLLTGLAFDDMVVQPLPPQSLSFVRPVGDAVDWLQRATALGLPNFGAASVFGVLIGSAAIAGTQRRFHLVGFADRADLVRHILGALAMGIGGVFALGCSIGQGITGVSTLSLPSMLAAASIVAGALFALKRLEDSL